MKGPRWESEPRTVPGLLHLDAATGEVHLDRGALPRAAAQVVFGRGSAVRVVPDAAARLASPARPGILVVVGKSSSSVPEMAELVNGLRRLEGRVSDGDGAPGATSVDVFAVQGHADHETIRAGIAAVYKVRAGVVVAIGGGTTIDVGKSVAALACQRDDRLTGITTTHPHLTDVNANAAPDVGAVRGTVRAAGAEADSEVDVDVAAYHLGRRHVSPERTLPWIGVPTTSGTGSESTDNAVIELGDEKRSLRGIPPAQLIVVDPALTDSLPFVPTIVAAVDALAQSLEVLTNSSASAQVQEVALAGFTALARGIEGLLCVATRASASGSGSGSGVSRGHVLGTIRPGGLGPSSCERVVRDTLSWGCLLMGIAFAHARLGLPHALAHFCRRFGLSHGNMVGILLAPGLAVQARDEETARRLERAARALEKALDPGSVARSGGLPEAHDGYEPLFRWLKTRISALFAASGLPSSLRAAGVSRADLDWIVARELESRPSFGTPSRPATPDELKGVLARAFDR